MSLSFQPFQVTHVPFEDHQSFLFKPYYNTMRASFVALAACASSIYGLPILGLGGNDVRHLVLFSFSWLTLHTQGLLDINAKVKVGNLVDATLSAEVSISIS